MNIQETEHQHLIPIYGKRDIALVRGEGVWLYDESGKHYLDLLSNLGASPLGHAHPKLTKNLQDQLTQLTNVHSSFYSDERARFLKALHQRMPTELSHSFICSTGTESTEAALKFARLITQRAGILSCRRGYHGRTYGALSATAIPKYQKGVGPLLPEVSHVPFNDLEALENALNETIAAFIVEPIQGEAGAILPASDYLKKAHELCQQHGVLLIADEVQTGLRTGSWLASESMGVTPDLVCLSKALGGGFPIGVTLMRGDLTQHIPKGSHGTTFGSNPLACVAARSTLEIIEENDLLTQSKKVGEYFLAELKTLKSPLIREVRGRGLMLAIDLKKRAGLYAKQLQENGVIVGATGTTLRLLPPLILTKKDVDHALTIFNKVLT